MPEGRPPIPRKLERALLMEAGYRCAIPTCRVNSPLEIDHIEPFAKIKEHTFENMIVLCRNCHGLKGDKRRQLDRKALRQYKANLSLLNGRYGELERRVLDHFASNPNAKAILLPGGLGFFLMYLVNDGLLDQKIKMTQELGYGQKLITLEEYSITEAGRGFVRHMAAAEPLDEYVDEYRDTY